MTRAHFAQTAHSEKTAREKYLSKNGTREERRFLLDVYSKRLEQCNNEEDNSETESVVSPHIEDYSDLEAPQQSEPSAPPTPMEKPPAVTRFNMIRDSLQSRPSLCQPGSSTQSVNHAEPLVDMPGGLSTYTSQPPKPRTVNRQLRDSLDSNDSRARLLFLLILCEN